MARTPILYGDLVSPPVRFAVMAADMMKVKLNFCNIDLFKMENKSDFFKKINPLQKVPALAIGNQVIVDSHCIVLYLCQLVRKQELYPDDPMERARVNEMLFFNSGSLFPIDSAVLSECFAGRLEPDSDKIEKWNSLLDHLENKLRKHAWLAGEKMTIADLCCAATITSFHTLIPFPKQYVKISQWLQKLEKVPGFHTNARGLERLRKMLDGVKSQAQPHQSLPF